MANRIMKIGSHVGMSGKDMMLGSAKEAYSYGANTFMMYTGAPQNTRRKDISQLKIDEAWNYMNEKGINDIVVHAPYIINLGNSTNVDTFTIAVEFLGIELERTRAVGSKILVVHPGAHVGAGVEKGIDQIAKGINEVLTADSQVYITLETMAGKGSEIGRNFTEIAQIYEKVKYNDKLRVCFDTCHTNDSGYDVVNNFDDVIGEFDKIIGKDQIAVIHLNDSKNTKGAMKDRHENIGFGNIGFDALNYIAHHKDFEDVPKILETPYIPSPDNSKKTFAPYKYEIEMLKNGVFDCHMKDKIILNK